MIELSEKCRIETERYSSKGNQFKWHVDNVWYKTDNNGYEGLAEYVVSKLLSLSTLKKDEFVDYELETIQYGFNQINGCRSNDFLKEGESLYTFERIYLNVFGGSLTELIECMYSPEERLEMIVNSIRNATGLENLGEYLTKTLIIDALFLNNDRHLHNLALIKMKNGNYRLCPIFDNGAALLSDTRSEYPMTGPVREMISSCRAKTISESFDKQLDAAEKMYGSDLVFHFDENDVNRIVDSAEQYDENIRNRVKYILNYQMKKYEYYFKK